MTGRCVALFRQPEKKTLSGSLKHKKGVVKMTHFVGKHKCFSGDNCLCVKQKPKKQNSEKRKALKDLQNKALRGLENK